MNNKKSGMEIKACCTPAPIPSLTVGEINFNTDSRTWNLSLIYPQTLDCEWIGIPPTENLTFYEAMGFLKDGYKIKRGCWDNIDNNYMSFNEDKRLSWHNKFFFDDVLFEYEDICATDWKAIKIDESEI